MLFILALLFLPCAIVGAFVTAEDHDLTAFQAVFSLKPFAGAMLGRSDAVPKDYPRSRLVGSPCAGVARIKDGAPAVSMLIGGSSQLPTSRSFGGAAATTTSDGCSARSPLSSVVIWPCADSGGGGGAISGASESCGASSYPVRRRRKRCSTAGSSSANSGSALRAMAIPARCALPSVDLLREAYGPRRSFWGDLSVSETRRFYHELLPVSVYLEALNSRGVVAVQGGDGERPLGGGMSGGGLATVVEAVCEAEGEFDCIFGAAETLEQRARLASMARHAARLYVRERCKLPSRVVAHLYDGLRHLKNYGSFRVTGMTWEELWEKYEKKIRAEDPSLEGEDLKTSVCLRILEKSCCTSEVVNNLSGCTELNTFLPHTASACPIESDAGCASGAAGTDDSDAEECCNEASPMQVLSSSSPVAAAAVANGLGQEKGAAEDETGSKKALERAYAAESAAACAGALRLTRLVRPFKGQAATAQNEKEASSGGKLLSRRSLRRRLGRRPGLSRRRANRSRVNV